MSKPVTGPMIAQVGTISATHDETIGRIIAERTFSWSRSEGLFAGVALEGATMRQDLDDNAELYGKELQKRDIVTMGVCPPRRPLNCSLG